MNYKHAPNNWSLSKWNSKFQTRTTNTCSIWRIFNPIQLMLRTINQEMYSKLSFINNDNWIGLWSLNNCSVPRGCDLLSKKDGQIMRLKKKTQSRWDFYWQTSLFSCPFGLGRKANILGHATQFRRFTSDCHLKCSRNVHYRSFLRDCLVLLYRRPSMRREPLNLVLMCQSFSGIIRH